MAFRPRRSPATPASTCPKARGPLTALTSSRWASSIGHLFDRPVVSSETWTWLHSPSFRATPLDVKAEADLHFCRASTSSSATAALHGRWRRYLPGWRFYAAASSTRRTRGGCDARHRALPAAGELPHEAGTPVNDVAVYVPTTTGGPRSCRARWGASSTRCRGHRPDLLPAIISAGFNARLRDDAVLAKQATAEAGRDRHRPCRASRGR